MSQFSDNLTAQLDSLGLEVTDVHAELNRRGVDVAYSTVAGWFNGSRGVRWKVDELKALLEVLQTTLDAMSSGEVEMVEGSSAKVALARELHDLPEAQTQAVLAMIRSMKGGVG